MSVRSSDTRTPQRHCTRESPASSKRPDSLENVEGILVICAEGDVILDFQSEESSDDLVSFRASSSLLGKASAYFQRLFEQTRFQEAADFI